MSTLYVICFALFVFIASKQWCKGKVRLCPYKRECLDIAQRLEFPDKGYQKLRDGNRRSDGRPHSWLVPVNSSGDYIAGWTILWPKNFPNRVARMIIQERTMSREKDLPSIDHLFGVYNLKSELICNNKLNTPLDRKPSSNPRHALVRSTEFVALFW